MIELSVMHGADFLSVVQNLIEPVVNTLLKKVDRSVGARRFSKLHDKLHKQGRVIQ